MARRHDIIGPATSLLGVSLIIITGLNVSRAAVTSAADEIAWGAAVALSISSFSAYLAIRSDHEASRAESLADRSFLIGMRLLFVSVLILAVDSA